MPPNTVAGQPPPSTNGSVPATLGELTFLVTIPGLELGQFSECSGLAVEYDVLEYEEGGNNDFVHRLRGRARYPVLSLRRGVTSQDALVRWFFNYQKNAQRPTLTITLLTPAASPMRRFAFAAAFPIKWSGPDVSAGSNNAATESLDIGHMGLVV